MRRSFLAPAVLAAALGCWEAQANRREHVRLSPNLRRAAVDRAAHFTGHRLRLWYWVEGNLPKNASNEVRDQTRRAFFTHPWKTATEVRANHLREIDETQDANSAKAQAHEDVGSRVFEWWGPKKLYVRGKGKTEAVDDKLQIEIGRRLALGQITRANLLFLAALRGEKAPSRETRKLAAEAAIERFVGEADETDWRADLVRGLTGRSIHENTLEQQAIDDGAERWLIRAAVLKRMEIHGTDALQTTERFARWLQSGHENHALAVLEGTKVVAEWHRSRQRQHSEAVKRFRQHEEKQRRFLAELSRELGRDVARRVAGHLESGDELAAATIVAAAENGVMIERIDRIPGLEAMQAALADLNAAKNRRRTARQQGWLHPKSRSHAARRREAEAEVQTTRQRYGAAKKETDRHRRRLEQALRAAIAGKLGARLKRMHYLGLPHEARRLARELTLRIAKLDHAELLAMGRQIFPGGPVERPGPEPEVDRTELARAIRDAKRDLASIKIGWDGRGPLDVEAEALGRVLGFTPERSVDTLQLIAGMANDRGREILRAAASIAWQQANPGSSLFTGIPRWEPPPEQRPKERRGLRKAPPAPNDREPSAAGSAVPPAPTLTVPKQETLYAQNGAVIGKVDPSDPLIVLESKALGTSKQVFRVRDPQGRTGWVRAPWGASTVRKVQVTYTLQGAPQGATAIDLMPNAPDIKLAAGRKVTDLRTSNQARAKAPVIKVRYSTQNQKGKTILKDGYIRAEATKSSMGNTTLIRDAHIYPYPPQTTNRAKLSGEYRIVSHDPRFPDLVRIETAGNYGASGWIQRKQLSATTNTTPAPPGKATPGKGAASSPGSATTGQPVARSGKTPLPSTYTTTGKIFSYRYPGATSAQSLPANSKLTLLALGSRTPGKLHGRQQPPGSQDFVKYRDARGAEGWIDKGHVQGFSEGLLHRWKLSPRASLYLTDRPPVDRIPKGRLATVVDSHTNTRFLEVEYQDKTGRIVTGWINNHHAAINGQPPTQSAALIGASVQMSKDAPVYRHRPDMGNHVTANENLIVRELDEKAGQAFVQGAKGQGWIPLHRITP